MWTVNAYVLGALQSETSERRAERESGLSKTQWQRAHWPYLQRMLATGRLPTLARAVQDATDPMPEGAFDQGLDSVLDGLAARLLR